MNKIKRKVGRPKEVPADKVDLKKVEMLAGLGLDDVRIALYLDYDERVIRNWKKNAEFNSALRRGKVKANTLIAGSLFEKAKGGDMHAIKFFLMNRDPELWRETFERNMDTYYPITFKIFPAKKNTQIRKNE